MPEPTPDATTDRLPLAATVGFTGHRRLDDEAAARAAMAGALGEIGRAFRIAADAIADAFDGAARLRLMIGAAPGADRLCADVWRAAELGEVHEIYPFRDPGSGAAWTDRPEKADPETRVEPAPEFAPWTGIDPISLGLGADHAHAEVARWIVRHADVLVAWWDGEPSRGAGGTADTVERTLARGLPVIWLQPGVAGVRLVDPAHAHRHADAAEALAVIAAIAQPLSAEALAPLLVAALGPPLAHDDDPQLAARRDYAALDPLQPRRPALAPLQHLLDRTAWTAFKRFEQVAGGPAPAAAAGVRPVAPDDVTAQPGYARLYAASREASGRANHLSAIHRSEQLLLIAIAVLAVLVGASPALCEPGEAQARAHVIAASLELSLGLAAFALTAAARRAHRHRRWSDARALAERFRGALATWPLGVDIADASAGTPESWTEWRARAVLRAAGPRRGWLDGPRAQAAAQWAGAQIIDGQVAYHARQHQVAHRIAANIERTEGAAFAVLMLTLVGYLVAAATARLTGGALPHLVGGVVTVISAVSPAIGAGCLALEATNGFGETALRSTRLEAAFAQLQAEFADSGAYHHAQGVLRRAAQLAADEADAWRDRLQRRRIVRGG